MATLNEKNLEALFISGVTLPIVTITRKSTYPTGRSVGFIHLSLGDNRYLVVTARHALEPEGEPHSYYIMLGSTYALAEVEKYILSPHAHDDIVFVVIKASNSYKPIKFLRPKNEQWARNKLFNVRNMVGEHPIVTLQPYMQTTENNPVNQQSVFTRYDITSREAWVIGHDEVERLEKFRSEGWSELGYMTLISRRGFSGSPIWDEDWRLYGMNVRGRDDSENGDVVGYYRSSYIDSLVEAIKGSL